MFKVIKNINNSVNIYCKLIEHNFIKMYFNRNFKNVKMYFNRKSRRLIPIVLK